MKDKKTMTFDEVISRFEKTFPFAEIDDCRPAWPEVYGTGGFGITVWLKNGDKVFYYPNEDAEPMGQLRTCPYCGSDARVSRLIGYSFMDEKIIIYQISCDASCKGELSVTADTMEEATREWNMRAKNRQRVRARGVKRRPNRNNRRFR